MAVFHFLIFVHHLHPGGQILQKYAWMEGREGRLYIAWSKGGGAYNYFVESNISDADQLRANGLYMAQRSRFWRRVGHSHRIIQLNTWKR